MRNNHTRFMVGCAATFSLGTMVGWLAPQITFGAMHRFDVMAARGGLLVLVEGVTIGFVTLLLGARPPRVKHRILAVIGVIVLILTNAASLWAPSFEILLGIRCIAGIADAVLTFVAVSLVAMRSQNPDRAYSVLTVVAVIAGASVVAAPPLLLPAVTGLAYLPFLAGISLLMTPLLAFLPKDSFPGAIDKEAGASVPATIGPDNRILFAILIAFMVPATFQSFMTFTLSPSLGERIGLSETEMNSLLGLATLVSILGPLAVGPAIRWLGHWWSLTVAAVLLVVIDLTAVMTSQPALFTSAQISNLVLLYFCVPVLLGWSAEIDPQGRFSSIMMGSVTMVTALSPSVAGEFVDHWGLESLTRVVTATGTLFLMFLLLIPLIRTRRRSCSEA